MAKKTCNILIEKYHAQNVLKVWMELDVAKIVKDIPGVVKVEYENAGYYHVIFDPRYDWEELQNEIEELANSYAED